MNVTEDIWHEYHLRLASFIRSKVSEDMQDDILQDVFVKIHTRLDLLKDDAKIESWLYQITRNTIIDYYRSRQTSQQLTGRVVPPYLEEEEAIMMELSLCLEPMIQKLPEKYRTAVQMSAIEHKSQKEVAEFEGISLTGAKSRVQRGRSLLKSMLYDCCQFEVNKRNQIVSYTQKEQDCKFC